MQESKKIFERANMRAVFCDDIRFEIGNKQSLIGIYEAGLFVDQFPAVLPKFVIMATATFPMDAVPKEMTFRAYIDDTNVQSFEVPKESLAAAATATSDDLPNGATRTLSINALFVFTPLHMEKPGHIRVRAETDLGDIRGPICYVKQLPSDQQN